jgi:hypothetical protein
MARPLITSPKVRWGIPLVLPHVLLSVGLLVFAAMSERPASAGAREIVIAPGAVTVDLSGGVRRG